MTLLSRRSLTEILHQLPLETEIRSSILTWLNSWNVSDALWSELEQMCLNSNLKGLTDAFFQELEFGTGGLRGIVGPGTNRMNEPAICRAAQGIANFQNAEFQAEHRRTVIAFDSRLYSKTFAEICAQVLCANGIQCYLFRTYETTPCLSFAVRELSCSIGLCLTASHNPPSYAGLKVYASDGAQIVPPIDAKVLAAVLSVTNSSQIRSMPLEDIYQSTLLSFVPEEVQNEYFNCVAKLQTHPDRKKTIKAVYTPLHGTGAAPARRVMEEWGFKSFEIVPSQEQPDGRFPTVRKPNPEEPEALADLIAFATEKKAEAGFATDPDSDRLALISKEPDSLRAVFSDQTVGDYVLLNGNQTGALLLSFILSEWKAAGRLPACPSVIKTIVTSEMHTQICNAFGVSVFSVLTGFKWIAAQVRNWEETHSPSNYIFGTEESFGYMPGTFVRDKDGIASLAMCAEMVDYLHSSKGHTPCAELLVLFERFGAWREDLLTIDLDGKSGKEKIACIMDRFRKSPPQFVAGYQILKIEDYSNGSIKSNLQNGAHETLSMTNKLPESDVLIFRLADGGQISIRPSGTEPKIKFYFSAVRNSQPDAIAGYISAKKATSDYQQSIEKIVSQILSETNSSHLMN